MLPLRASALGAPAAEALVEVEGSRAVAQLDIAQPLSHDIQERSIQPDSSTHQRDYYPRLARIVRLCNRPPHAPIALLAAPERPSIPPCLATQLLPRSVLYPVDGREVFVALDLGNLFDDYMRSVRGVCGFGVVGVGERGD